MSKDEKIILIGDTIQGPTGFATDLAGVSWSLAKDYDVHILGLQTFQEQEIDITLEGEKRTVLQHPNFPRTNQRFDFGWKSIEPLLNRLEPDMLISVNDIQMINHIPQVMCPDSIKLKVIDLPSREFLKDYELKLQLDGAIAKFKEKYPSETKWIQYAPQDGEPPMQMWKSTYDMADQVVSMAKYGQYVFDEYYKIKTPYIYHGYDSKVFTNRDKSDEVKDKFVIGNFNRNQPRKQPIRMIEAYAKFAKDKDDVLLHMQMDWNDEFGWPIEYYMRHYEIPAEKVIIPLPHGMDRQAVSNVYNMWDLNVTPTGGEGFGLTHIEGFGCGLPSIATDYTTSRELIMEGKPNPRGTLVPYTDKVWQVMSMSAVQRALIDIDKLAETFEMYYNDRDLVKRHGKNAEEWAKKNVTWDVIQNKWQDLVGKVLAGEKVEIH